MIETRTRRNITYIERTGMAGVASIHARKTQVTIYGFNLDYEIKVIQGINKRHTH